MNTTLRAHAPTALLIGLLATLSATVHATEGGGTVYPNGADSFSAGAMPPLTLHFSCTFAANLRTGSP